MSMPNGGCSGSASITTSRSRRIFSFARREVEVRLTPRTVEVFLKGERIAVHLRISGNHHHTTVPEHMPSSHRRYADWTVHRIRQEATAIGPATAALCELILVH
jgi:transposase